MPYPWECLDCALLDMNDTKWGDAYCKYYKRYVDPASRSCDHLVKKNNSGGGCYLTTCMCEVLGFEDHCNTLDSLRSFRDDYMKNDPECLPLLEDYDVVGPLICDRINSDDNKFRTAHVMLLEYVVPAIGFINNNDYDSAIEIYKNMTTDLMDYYGLDKSILTSERTICSNKQRKMNPCLG